MIGTKPVDEVRMWLMTWQEVEGAIAAGRRTAVIAVGASEQHGPHLPEATDNLIGESLACRLARSLGDALVAPVIPVGCSDHHLDFAGTLSIDADLLMALLDAYLASLRRHGFTRFIVFSSHGGNFPVLAEWRRRQPTDAVVISDLGGQVSAMLGAVRRFGREDLGGPHADVTETALMLLLRPDLVREDLVEVGWVDPVPFVEMLDLGLRKLSPNGVLGDPRAATAEMGKAVFESVAEFLVSSVRVCLGEKRPRETTNA